MSKMKNHIAYQPAWTQQCPYISSPNIQNKLLQGRHNKETPLLLEQTFVSPLLKIGNALPNVVTEVPLQRSRPPGTHNLDITFIQNSQYLYLNFIFCRYLATIELLNSSCDLSLQKVSHPPQLHLKSIRRCCHQ